MSRQSVLPYVRALAILAGNKPYLLLTLAYTVQLFAYNPIEFWLPTVLQRDKGMPLVQANSTYRAIVLVAGTLGPLLGGVLADRFAQRSSVMYYRICIVTALASVLPILGILLLPNVPALFSAIFAEVFLANMSTGVVFTILVTIVIPGLRATATAVLLIVIHVLDDAISEPLMGSISSRLATVDSGKKLAQAAARLLPPICSRNTWRSLFAALQLQLWRYPEFYISPPFPPPRNKPARCGDSASCSYPNRSG